MVGWVAAAGGSLIGEEIGKGEAEWRKKKPDAFGGRSLLFLGNAVGLLYSEFFLVITSLPVFSHCICTGSGKRISVLATWGICIPFSRLLDYCR